MTDPSTSNAPAPGSGEGGAALTLDGVRKVYRSGDADIVAVDHASLTVGSGEIVALLGPSGSGKTTLLSIAGGLLSPTAGTVVVGGHDITRLSPRELTEFRRSSVGFVFQSVNLVPFLTAEENLVVVDEIAGRRRTGPKVARARARQLLDELGLGHRADNLPAQLSGGERQRVAIGRALFNSPALVLFDEPTSALDTVTGGQVMELIQRELRSRRTAAVIVTHDTRMTHYADRMVRIVDGVLGADTDADAGPLGTSAAH
ncbi:MAG: ABC transporter ATP-binding protein [Ilumatobacteraceae bacterium]